MPRTHALQARKGEAATLNVRVTDAERARLARMAKRGGPETTVSDVVREAIARHLAFSSGNSPFLDVFGRVITDLADVEVHPIVVGMWAAAAHGYLTPTERFELVVREDEIDRLRHFLAARGAAEPARPLPFELGRRPWAMHFATTFDGVAANDLPTVRYCWDATWLDVVSLDTLIDHAPQTLPDYVHDALREIKAGTFHLDDGERGLIAWDAVGRFTASGAYSDPLSRPPHRFVDFRLVRDG